MKNVKLILFLCALFLGIELTQAQPILYGITPAGGENTQGTILKLNTKDKTLSAAKSFSSYDLGTPTLGNGFIKASDGLLYAPIANYGNFGAGGIIAFNPSTSVYTIKHHFKYDGNGASPTGKLVQAKDGKLYGLTQGGGVNSKGVIYSFDPVTSNYILIYSLNGLSSNENSLIQASNDKLYGIASGGDYGSPTENGAIYSYDLVTNTFETIAEFNSSTISPRGSWIQVGDEIFATAIGALNYTTYQPEPGVIFGYNLTTSTFTIHHTFNGLDGSFPWGSLIQAADGKLYGVTNEGGPAYDPANYRYGRGTIFSFDPKTLTTTTNLHNFDPQNITTIGYAPRPLILGSDNKLYGVTYRGGLPNKEISNGSGSVFSFDPTNLEFNYLAKFGGKEKDPMQPIGSLAEVNGTLFGLTQNGPSNSWSEGRSRGSIYKLTINGVTPQSVEDGTSYENVRRFGSNETGNEGNGGLVKVGNLFYGTSKHGGLYTNGTIFSFNPENDTYTVLYNFGEEGISGIEPADTRLLHIDGKLYGVTERGAVTTNKNLRGVIYSFDLQTKAYQVLYTSGDNPATGIDGFMADLIKDPNSNKVYGTIRNDNNKGSIFSFDFSIPNSFQIEYEFKDVDGGRPRGSIVMKNGVLYGATNGNVSYPPPNYEETLDKGILFSYDPGTQTFSSLHAFNPDASLKQPYPAAFGRGITPIVGKDGNLYFTTEKGGDFDAGTLSKYDFTTSSVSVLKSFQSSSLSEGVSPVPGIMQGSDGLIYGMTEKGGGPDDFGTIFSHDPLDPNSFVTIASLDAQSGSFDEINNKKSKYNVLAEYDIPVAGPASFTTEPAATIVNENATYTTESGKSNYVWTVPGVLNTDYSIVSGGLGATDNTVTIKWLTAGSKNVKVTYTDATAEASNSTAVSAPTFLASPAANLQNEDATYTTESGKSNYVWTIPGVLNTDYAIASGGIGLTDNTVTIKWLTTGSKAVEVTYGNAALKATNSTSISAPTFTANPAASINVNTNATYTTQAGKSNYVWTVPGVLNTDYTIVSGGIGSTDNTVTLSWLTAGSKTVEVTYGNAAIKASTSSTLVNLPAATFTVKPADQICVNTTVTYTTQSGKSNYVWTVPGVNKVDYIINSGGLSNKSASVKLTWKTPGQKIVSVNYANTSAAAIHTTTVNATPTTTFSGPATVNPSQAGIVESIPSAGNGATYTWTITNGKITAGKTTNSIIYNAGASGKVTLCVTVKNSTGCTATATKTVTIVKITTITPTFNPIASICKGAKAPSLPSVSKNGVRGTWSPAVINTATVGTKSYTFTPAAGQAAKSVSISVTIKNCKAGSGSAANATAAGIESNGLTLDAVVFPNPSNANFKLTIKSMSAERASVRVVSMMGTIMDTRLANSGETVQFGDNYNKGIYLIEIVQGNEKKLMKVMKQ